MGGMISSRTGTMHTFFGEEAGTAVVGTGASTSAPSNVAALKSQVIQGRLVLMRRGYRTRKGIARLGWVGLARWAGPVPPPKRDGTREETTFHGGMMIKLFRTFPPASLNVAFHRIGEFRVPRWGTKCFCTSLLSGGDAPGLNPSGPVGADPRGYTS